MIFSDEEIFAGTNLILEAMRSPDFASGTAGWSINKDGTAEFNNVSVRGTVIAKDATGSTATLSANTIGTGPLAHLAALAMQPASNTGDPAVIGATANMETLITSPSPVIGGAPVSNYSEILMSPGVISLFASAVQLGSLRVANDGAISQATGVSINGMLVDSTGKIDQLMANNRVVGNVVITPSAANVPTSVVVTFPQRLTGTTMTCQVSANSTVIGTQVNGVSYSALGPSSVTIWLNRSTLTATTVSYAVEGF